MKFPLSWVAEYVDLSGLTPASIADRLIQAGLEVEEIISVGDSLCHIVTGRIESIEKHPDADRLQITQIFDGTETHQVVTGAQNISVGDIVPISLPGAVLANGLKIKPSKLRGVPSNGMLCSEVELGVADVSEGIWILEPTTPLGVDFVEYAVLKDTILDISILPNRGDCQSILGLARELSVVLSRPLQVPSSDYVSIPGSMPFTVSVADSTICPVYRAGMVTSIMNGVAPLVMRRRLALAGTRSIDLIVDITNYVLLETGQPLHAFDSDYLIGTQLTVGYATNGEMCQTLDDEVRELNSRIPVIRDQQSIVAVAGVMGGKRGSVTASSTALVVEAAYFSPTLVRRSRAQLGVRTESSIRFEKGVDPDGVQFGLNRALHLFQTLAGATILTPQAQYVAESHPILTSIEIEFNSEKINRLLGTAYSLQDMTTVLSQLGFQIQSGVAVVPSWRRHDVKEWPCLAEEIARIFGFDPISDQLEFPVVLQPGMSRLRELATETESFFVHQGFQQVQTFTMVSPEDFKATKVPLPSEWLQIQNPLTTSESVLRRYLMPSLLRTVAHNLKRQNGDLQFFEVGKVFYLAEGGQILEHLVCGAICTGSRFVSPYLASDKANAEHSFFQMKGLVEELLDQLGVSGVTYSVTTYPQYHPYMSADIRVSDATRGNVGFIHPDILENYDIKQSVAYIGLNLSGLVGEPIEPIEFKAFGRFPHTRRDVAILAPKSLSYSDIQSEITRLASPNVVKYFLFDYFESEKIGDDKKSLAFGFVYQDMERTLSDDEVNQLHDEFCKQLVTSLPVSIR